MLLVDTGATGLCLPKSLIEQLGLTPLRQYPGVQTANGPAERTFYSEVTIYRPGTKPLHPGNRPP